MNINTETITTMTEANQNFSKVAKVAENNGQAVIFKNNKPKFLLIDVDSNSYFDITDDEKIDVAAKRIMNRFKPAFKELAKWLSWVKKRFYLLHQLIAEETGGSFGVRDIGLLESALNNAYATFDGEELYKTKEEKAASLG